MRCYLNNFLFTSERGASLEALERRGVGEDQAWINHHKLGKPNSLPNSISFSVKANCLQVY